MNRTSSTSRFEDLYAVGRPALLVLAIAAASSCHTVPASNGSVAFNASNALPAIGSGESALTPPTTGRPLPPDIDERMSNGLSLDFYEKSRIIGDDREAERLYLVGLYATTLADGLGLLGFEAPEHL